MVLLVVLVFIWYLYCFVWVFRLFIIVRCCLVLVVGCYCSWSLKYACCLMSCGVDFDLCFVCVVCVLLWLHVCLFGLDYWLVLLLVVWFGLTGVVVDLVVLVGLCLCLNCLFLNSVATYWCSLERCIGICLDMSLFELVCFCDSFVLFVFGLVFV